MHCAIFIDKDGTLIKDIPYNVRPDLIELNAGAKFFMDLMRLFDFKIIMVTNQPGIAHGYFTEKEFLEAAAKIEQLAGCHFDKIVYCPHHPKGTVKGYAKSCSCRKPSPVMIFRTAVENQINLKRSWMIGDILHDIEAGNRAGCRTILIDNGGETEWNMHAYRKPDHIVSDLYEAAFIILSHIKRKKDAGKYHRTI